MNHDDEWSKIWDARVSGMESILGPSHDQVYHSAHPFELGGFADVISFHRHIDGIVHVTSELTGKPEERYADYELMICQREEDDWGANIISRLAQYTQECVIASGESMDIDGATPSGSAIKAFIFDTYHSFDLFGDKCELRLCIGITKDELGFKMKNGSGSLLKLLKKRNVYPYTDLNRRSVLT